MKNVWKGKFIPLSVKFEPVPKKEPQKQSDVPKKDIVKDAPKKASEQDSSVQLFDRLYEENKEKLLMQQTFPINHEAVAEWLAALEKDDPFVLKVARYVAIGLQHISFNEFYDSLTRGAYEAVSFCEKENFKIVLIVSGWFAKSNFWTSLLVWPVIRKYVRSVIGKIEHTEAETIKNLSSNTLVLQVDDGSYSGQQLYVYARDNWVRYLTQQPNVRWMIVVGAMSTTAKNAIRILDENILFSSSSIAMLSFVELVEKLSIAETGGIEVADKFFYDLLLNKAATLQIDKKIHMSYFDHKLPDSTSTVNKILAIAPAKDKTTGTTTLRSLIKGCDVADYRFDRNRPPTADSYIDDFEQNAVCPLSFYKAIKYTFEGKALDGFDSWYQLVEREIKTKK